MVYYTEDSLIREKNDEQLSHLKILLMDCHPVVCRLSNNFALIIILSQKWSSYQDNMFTCTKKALKKGGFFYQK